MVLSLTWIGLRIPAPMGFTLLDVGCSHLFSRIILKNLIKFVLVLQNNR